MILKKIEEYKKLDVLTYEELEELAKEIRSQIINSNSLFLGSSLGIVDLAVALSYVFDFKVDSIFWDIGHQKGPFTLIQKAIENKPKIAPYLSTKPATALSSAVGQAIFRDMNYKNYDIISVIGDLSLASGQAFEAMNHAGSIASKIIVVLNDNADQKFAGALGYYLQHLEHRKGSHDQHSLFEDLGFNYIGPLDGHNIEDLIKVLTNVKESKEKTPVLIHIKTKKGKGYLPAEADADGLNSSKDFDKKTGIQEKETIKSPPHYACKALIEAAHLDPKIVVVSLAIPKLESPFMAFRDLYPERYFEGGVTEGHAMSLAIILAQQGLKPYVILYSNFLQRVLDQSMIDACLQNIHVRFIIDHSSVVFETSPYAGLFDSTFLGTLSNMILMSPSCQEDIEGAIHFSAGDIVSPCVIRLSKEINLTMKKVPKMKLGKGAIYKKGEEIALLSYGGMLDKCLKASQVLTERGISVTVIDARFLQPLDDRLIIDSAKKHKVVISLEENASGGFATHVMDLLNRYDMLQGSFKFYPLYIRDVEQDKELTIDNIVNTVTNLLELSKDDSYYIRSV